jgi:hypothetical protein
VLLRDAALFTGIAAPFGDKLLGCDAGWHWRTLAIAPRLAHHREGC